MQLYSGHSTRFIEDTVQNQIAGKLNQSFFEHFRFNAPHSEVRSWHNSLTGMKDIFQRANFIDHGVVLEYQLPLTSKRLDCMIIGKAADPLTVEEVAERLRSASVPLANRNFLLLERTHEYDEF